MTKIIALTNQKGGVGKTTSSVNIAASLAVSEFNTLLLDMDPQANASTGISEIIIKNSGYTVYDTLVNQISIKDVITKTSFEYLDIILSTNDLVGAEIELVSVIARELELKKALKTIDNIYTTLKDSAYKESCFLARERGAFEVFDWEKEKD